MLYIENIDNILYIECMHIFSQVWCTGSTA